MERPPERQIVFQSSPSDIKILTDALRDPATHISHSYNSIQTEDEHYIYVDTEQFQFAIFLTTGNVHISLQKPVKFHPMVIAEPIKEDILILANAAYQLRYGHDQNSNRPFER